MKICSSGIERQLTPYRWLPCRLVLLKGEVVDNTFSVISHLDDLVFHVCVQVHEIPEYKVQL